MEFRGLSDRARDEPAKPARDSEESVIPLLVAAICAGELVLVFVHLALGVLLAATTLGAILVLQAVRGPRIESRAMVPLALVPLLRILSLTMPLPGFPPVYWMVLVGAPLAIGGVIAARAARLDLEALGLGRVRWGPQVFIAALGIPAGLGAWLSGRPTGLIGTNVSPGELLVIAVILVVFVGITEEFIFRGVIQAGLTLVHPRSGVLLAGILYGTSYLGTLSFGYAAYMTVVGLGYGALVQRTRSIVGASASHALLIVGALLVWPGLMR